MAGVARTRSTSRRRTVAYAIGAGVVVLLIVAGLAFANSISVTRVTNNARSLHWTNATMGTSALTRAGLVQAVTFAELQGNGVVTAEDLDFAMDQIDASVSELDYLLAIGDGHESYAALARFVVPVHETVAALDSRDVTGAKQVVQTEVESSYVNLSNALSVEQDSIQAEIEDNSQAGKALNGWVVFVLMLIVPASAVGVYFVVARRQVKAVRERTRLELEAEREVSRAKDAFIAGLSHELRTPLTSIYGFAEILTDGGITGPEATEETAQIIANEAAEMTRMVDDLLAASRLESTGVEIEMTATPVQEVVDAAAKPFERAGLEIRREPTIEVVSTDAARLRHVLINLLSNAARHGGPEVGIEVTSGEGVIDIEVWDNGPGVPEDRVERLFERWVHNGDAPLLTGSVGLGLAIASRLVDLMGGSLQYQRFAGKTYFVVTVPQAERESHEAPDESSSVSEMIKALSG